MKIVPSSKIYLAQSKINGAGRGVYSAKYIKKDELIEQSPVVVLPEENVENIRKTELLNYYFMWGGDESYHRAAICLGFGSLYNHSYAPNGTYKKVIDRNLIEFYAIHDIKPNEEITINYNYGNPNDTTTLWIKDISPYEK